MVPFKAFIVLFALSIGAYCGAEDTSLSVEAMVKRINERYDDFFRFHREQEQRWQKMRSGVDERKQRERAHAERLERAREQYVKTRRERPSDERLRLRWEADQKERAEQYELFRKRYVQRRDTVEQYLKKGRQIPEMKEFDLEGY